MGRCGSLARRFAGRSRLSRLLRATAREMLQRALDGREDRFPMLAAEAPDCLSSRQVLTERAQKRNVPPEVFLDFARADDTLGVAVADHTEHGFQIHFGT